MVLRPVKGAERTLILTDIGVIDVAVDKERHDTFGVFPATHSISSFGEIQ
jgi:hypothetical protein